MRLPDSQTLAGTATTRSSMLRTAAVFAALALVCLIIGFGGFLVTFMSAIFAIAGIVLLYLATHRLLWALKRRRVDLLVVLAAVWLTVLVTAAVLAPLLPLAEHEDVVAAINVDTYLAPFTFADHPLGTNGNGLDLLARAIYGARVSLVIAAIAVSVGTIVGGSIGVFSGYYRKGVDRTVGIFTNSLLAVPPLILLIALAAVLAPNVRNIALSLSLLTIPTMIRMARANTIAFSQREFVTAARALGATKLRVMWRELVPNVAVPLMSMAVVVASGLIVAEASLSFLGLGLPQPTATWGNMIAEPDNQTLLDYPFMVIVPGVFLFLTVFSLNLLGERAQKRWDTRSAKL